MITGGFGMTMDLERGTMRQWVMGRDDVKRWADTNEPVETTMAAREMNDGELWSWVRSVMAQGACIQQDYASGLVHKSYEEYSARLDAAASERADELSARLKVPNV